ncbi:MAG: hypothetical protein AABX31_04355 [Nanoarchaeota archaeon]
MLQQTQVPRVIEKFKEFTERFPTLQDLAKASKAEVIESWSGLGYNRRALLLHRFAQQVCEKYGGEIPQNKEELQELPGMGPYTTGAILSFAFNLPEPAIDVNVRRIYLRFFQGRDQGLPMSRKEEQELYEFAKQTIPQNKSTDFHNALMDFGSSICTRNTPSCNTCPLQNNCAFFPLYKNHKEKALFVMEKKKEQGTIENGKHIPNRIFRGRMVEFARKNQGREVLIYDLGKVIKKDYQNNEEKWLLSLLRKLQNDGLLNCQKVENKLVLSLPR